MAANTAWAARTSPTEVARLRATVLRLGRRLGWPPEDVAAFAAALTGRHWHGLRRAELEAVRDEYRQLLAVVAAKAARRAARAGGGPHASGR
jgi:hypothetical protein